jgi:hypothetical protein
MEFEDMKVIWDSQEKAPLYAMNEEGLHDLLRGKGRKFRRLIFWQQWQSYLSSLFVVLVIFAILGAHFLGAFNEPGELAPTTGWDVMALLVAAACWIQFAVSIYIGQKRQERREREFAGTLLGDVDRDIEQTRYQITTRRNIVTGFIPPYVGACLIQLVVFRSQGLSEWTMVPVIALLIFCLIVESRSQQRLVDQTIHPRLRELETLRAKLTDPES